MALFVSVPSAAPSFHPRLAPATASPGAILQGPQQPFWSTGLLTAACASAAAVAGRKAFGSRPGSRLRGARGSRAARQAAAFPSPVFFVEELQRRSLKGELLAALKGSERGTQTSPEQKAIIDGLIDQLAKLNPTDVAGSRLSGRWNLLWTTEKETLSIVSNGILGRKCTEVYQVIDVEADSLSNNIDFEGGGFEVDSTCRPSDGIRVDFQFRAAKIRFDSFTLPLPPVGQGWFDCVFLDDELRIVRDSRQDALIAQRV